ncbi:rCG55009 [Rattus norvegicus]|uniref:RCG55009 n=1 Tax=Rattus norvegicus TaxID=10116 RepID=A6IJA1_RAT|nr:rCG55009 [Rattus norvegicus]
MASHRSTRTVTETIPIAVGLSQTVAQRQDRLGH